MATGAVVAAALMNKAKSKRDVQSEGSFSKSHRVLNPGVTTEFTAEMRAATLIARAWRRRFRGTQLNRVRLVERLMIEDAVCVGMFRLILFLVMFLVLFTVTSLGPTSRDRRAVEIVLTDTLSLDGFQETVTLPDFRERIKELSAAIKVFSASGSVRFPDHDAIEIVGPAQSFASAKLLPGLDIGVASEEFTLVAWVANTDGSHSTRPLIRKPMSTNQALNCWGWYFPGTLRYGAQDYHSVKMDMELTWEEELSSGADIPIGTIVHEAVVVHNHTVFFYRQGVLLNAGGTVLPRALTDCEGMIEIGSAGLELSQVKFYPRALPTAELLEMVVSGQPLSEIATGSKLVRFADDAHATIKAEIDGQEELTAGLTEEVAEKRIVDDIVADAEQAESEAEREAALYPADPSPPAVLHPLDAAETLPEHEKHAWEQGGAPRDWAGAVTDEWREEGAAGSYWSVFDTPVYARPATDPEQDVRERNQEATPLTTMNLTGVPAGTEVLTFTFWVRGVDPTDKFSTLFRIGALGEYDILGFHLLSYGAAALRVSDAHMTWAQLTEDFFAAYQSEGPLDEKFFISGFNHDAVPTAWRHVAVQFFLKQGFHKSFLDGRLVASHLWHAAHGALWDVDTRLLQGKNVSLASAPWYGTGKVKGKVAQFRMYPRELSQREIQEVQDSAVWPDGSAVKECKEVLDNAFQDTEGLDHHGRSCSWYHKVMAHTGSNLVCTSAAAKAQCPLTCRGARECSSGYPFDGLVHDEHHEELAAHAHQHFRIFDRIMHLKPATADLPTIVCPAASVGKAAVLAACRAANASYSAQPHFFAGFEESLEDTWAGHGRVDARDCEALHARMDEEQCGWDDSWVPTLLHDLEATRALSVSWWAHSVAGSPGMPARFSPSFLLFGELVPPRTLLDVREQNPFQEASTRLAMPTSEAQLWSDVNHRQSIDFASDWTFYYVSFKRLESGDWEQCLAVNGFPQQCSHSPHHLPLPDRFLAAVEFTGEMLVSPLEFSTEVLSTSELQEKYYRSAVKMGDVTGPRVSEVERIQQAEAPSAKEAKGFAESVLLAAPPFLYQTRAAEERCGSKVMEIFLQKQLELIEGTHCLVAGTCPGVADVDDVYACKGSPGSSEGLYFGVELTAHRGEMVYADFLYSFADNEVVVREGDDHAEHVLPAVEVVDRATDRANVLCLFHAPTSGDTTVLDIVMSTGGARVEVEVAFQHFGYLTSAQRRQCVAWWAAFFVLGVVAVLLNVIVFWFLFKEKSDFPDVGWDAQGVFECVYDWVQVLLLFVYGVVKLQAQLKSEDDAMTLVSDFVAVPFRDSNETVQSKVDAFFNAVNTMRNLLASEDSLQVFGFVMMILMLIRIINATAVHPRTGVLIGTIWNGMNDIWHFSILFMLVFVFSSMVSAWSFGTRAEFADLSTSMQTQFDMLLGSLPEGYAEDPLLVIYVALTNIVQFFLMLNFLLAIVVESYMAVREKIQALETDNEVTYDVLLTLYFGAQAVYRGWPNRRRIAVLLKNRSAMRGVSWVELHVLGVERRVAVSMIEAYAWMDALQTEDWKVETDLEGVGRSAEHAMRAAEQTKEQVRVLQAKSDEGFADVHAKLDAMMASLGCTPVALPPAERRRAEPRGSPKGDARSNGTAGEVQTATVVEKFDDDSAAKEARPGSDRDVGGTTETEDVLESLDESLNTMA